MTTAQNLNIARQILAEKVMQYETEFGPLSEEDFNAERFLTRLAGEKSVDLAEHVKAVDLRAIVAIRNRLKDRGFSVNFEKACDRLDKTKKTAFVVWFDPTYRCVTLNEVMLSDADSLIKETWPLDFDCADEINEDFAACVGRSVLGWLAERNGEMKVTFKG